MFARLRVWDTEHNNGVLVYLLLADRRIEIVADRGIDARVGAAAWQAVCARHGARARAGALRGAASSLGMRAIGELLARISRRAKRRTRTSCPTSRCVL